MPKLVDHNYFIYITTNPQKKVLYTGVTNDLSFRIIQHWQNRGKDETFAGRYYCYNLIYYEHFNISMMQSQGKRKLKDGAGKKSWILSKP